MVGMACSSIQATSMEGAEARILEVRAHQLVEFLAEAVRLIRTNSKPRVSFLVPPEANKKLGRSKLSMPCSSSSNLRNSGQGSGLAPSKLRRVARRERSSSNSRRMLSSSQASNLSPKTS